jgi:hypothetical protein
MCAVGQMEEKMSEKVSEKAEKVSGSEKVSGLFL